jgi:hypothetical protein
MGNKTHKCNSLKIKTLLLHPYLTNETASKLTLTMKLLLILASLFSFNSLQLIAQNNNQGPFTIQKNDKFGCINDKGQVIIEPIFANLGHFTDGTSRENREGVASARLGGYFGFIDASGQWVLAPQFEFATEFHDGAAIVYQNGKRFYINHLGQKLFDASVANSLKDFDAGLALFTTRSQKIGIWGKRDTLWRILFLVK